MNSLKNVYMIVAMTNKTNAIGINGHMLYHIHSDLKYFKDITTNNTIICGSNTYKNLPIKPLPNRKNIVITNNPKQFNDVDTLSSRKELIEYAKNNPNENIFIIGGDAIYHQFLDLASKLYITEIEEDEDIEADSFFPKLNMNEWTKIKESDYIKDNDSPKYKFVVYEKNNLLK